MAIQNIRVKASKKYHKIYHELSNENAFHGKVFETYGNLFVLCANLAFNLGYEKVDSLEDGEPLFWSHSLKSEGESCIKSIAVLDSDNDYSILENEEKVIQIVVEELALDHNEVTPDANFIEDLGADSLDVVELVMAFEEEFGLEIPDEDAENISTVQEAVDYIEKNI